MSFRMVSTICLAVLLITAPLWARRRPTIVEVFVDNPHDPTSITIIGEGFSFGREPVVTFGEVGQLTLDGVPTDTRIVALLPVNIAAGDYLLSVSTGRGIGKNDEYNLTIGAVGPTGPMGPDGPAGPAGPPDPVVAAMVAELTNEVCRLYQQTGQLPRPTFCPPPPPPGGTCPCAAEYEIVDFSATPTCEDEPASDNQLLLGTAAGTERLVSRFKEGSVTNLCQARDEVGNDLFFNHDILSNADAEACRAIIFARASSLGVVCQ